ncbi:MAG: hypothetical protein WEE36_04675 [Acidimicrobiia bacterium]
MIPGSAHRRFGRVMWGGFAVTFVVLTAVVVLRLDARIARYAVGALVMVCLVTCGLALWIESRAGRATVRVVRRQGASNPRSAWDVRPMDSPAD